MKIQGQTKVTERLYYEDVYQKEFDAEVTRAEKEKDGWHIYVDRTAFFPEGGGQSGDRGWLLTCPEESGESAEGDAAKAGPKDPSGRIEVTDTQEDGEDVYLVCGREIPAGSRVHGSLDWKFRFDRMQNHSGEHIVSGIIHRRYGYQNVGFHMSADRMTIDLSGEIPDHELAQIEQEANEIVWRNVPVHTDVYTEQEAEKVEFRSKKELHGIIRVVTIPGADVCACCGTHVTRTGEIGPIRLISHERFRGGIRIEMMCGRWAYEYMSAIFEQNHLVSGLVSARPLETAQGVQKVLDIQSALKMELLKKRYIEIDQTAQNLSGKGSVLIFARDYDPVLVQKLAAKVMETCGGCAAVMSGDDENGYRYALGETGGDLKELVKGMNKALDGRGGGRPYFQQGSLKADRKKIEEYLREKIEGLSVEEV